LLAIARLTQIAGFVHRPDEYRVSCPGFEVGHIHFERRTVAEGRSDRQRKITLEGSVRLHAVQRELFLRGRRHLTGEEVGGKLGAELVRELAKLLPDVNPEPVEARRRTEPPQNHPRRRLRARRFDLRQQRFGQLAQAADRRAVTDLGQRTGIAIFV
jgi:hypothetical protein